MAYGCAGQRSASVGFDDGKSHKIESLSSWVSKVRTKVIKVKACRKRDLRRVAILCTALANAETNLLAKQRHRARAWAEMQTRLGLNQPAVQTEEDVRKEKTQELWKAELKGLDDFFVALDNFKDYNVTKR